MRKATTTCPALLSQNLNNVHEEWGCITRKTASSSYRRNKRCHPFQTLPHQHASSGSRGDIAANAISVEHRYRLEAGDRKVEPTCKKGNFVLLFPSVVPHARNPRIPGLLETQGLGKVKLSWANPMGPSPHYPRCHPHSIWGWRHPTRIKTEELEFKSAGGRAGGQLGTVLESDSIQPKCCTTGPEPRWTALVL